ncbi:MAG: dipeptidase [Lachnospiraceae bacterium]|nr:dipeptidase [Lachnospiraceae bacterium]
MYSYIDMHCDTLLQTLHKGSSLLYENEGMQSLKLMHEAKQMCQFFAIFFPPRQENKENPTPTDEEFFRILCRNFYEEIEKHPYTVAFAHNYDDIRKNWEKGLSSAILTVEDGRMVDGKMENLKMLYEQGVRAIALTWNFSNCFGYPNSEDKSIMQKGLTDFGKDALAEMNQRGILIDVSHLSDGGFYDVALLSKKPFIASHSNCRALTPHSRNMTDDMIRTLAEHGGVAGLNFYSEFVNSRRDGVTSVEDLVAHVMHFIKIGGEDCIGIGTDYDGIENVPEISNPTQMLLLFDALQKKGVTPRQLDKLASGNVLRVIKEAMK